MNSGAPEGKALRAPLERLVVLL